MLVVVLRSTRGHGVGIGDCDWGTAYAHSFIHRDIRIGIPTRARGLGAVVLVEYM